MNVLSNAMTNLVLFVVFPFLIYWRHHARRNGLGFGAVRRRAGLQLGHVRYVWICVLVSFGVVVALLLWPPPVEPFTREGSAQRVFAGLGLGLRSIVSALLYGGVQTGFSEEFLFRGLIAGSLSRRLSVTWANVTQASIFLIPHLLLLSIMPHAWPLLFVVFAGALFAGWIRFRSESMIGPWILHATANITMALSIASRSAAS